jgi:hypothetical protein
MTTETIEAAGYLHVLSVGKGDVRIEIRDGEEDLQKAEALITDLLRRGAAIVVEDAAGRHRRVKRFDAKKRVYILQSVPGESEPPAPVPVQKGKATAIGRTAGG